MYSLALTFSAPVGKQNDAKLLSFGRGVYSSLLTGAYLHMICTVFGLESESAATKQLLIMTSKGRSPTADQHGPEKVAAVWDNK